MRIGILIKRFEDLANWELRIINEIISDESLELGLLIMDGRSGDKDQKSIKTRIRRLIKSKNILGKILFAGQFFIENKIFRLKYTVDRKHIIQTLKTIDTVHLEPKRKGFLDVFSIDDAELIESYSLDIILRHEFNIIRGAVLNSSKYGIWSFHHGDNAINRGGPAGFWEILLKQPTVGVTLQQLTPELDGGLVIDKAFFNRHWSYVKTKNELFEGSVSLLFKNIRQLQAGSFAPTKSPVYYNSLYRVPSALNTLKYIQRFYFNITSKIIGRLCTKLLGVKYNYWTLFIAKGDFMNSTLFRLKPVTLPKNEFWADPFLVDYKDETYVFFENYEYSLNKGKISCGKVRGNELVEVSDALVMDYHLSFPYVFKDDKNIYLMPESSQNNRLEIYKCIDFPTKWELYSTAFDGEKIADAFFFDDENNVKWLFLNKKVDLNVPMNNELFIYKVDSLKLTHLVPHTMNPVIIDARVARNGGSIFKMNDEYYRPSQANVEGVYGRALNINKIETLTIDEYTETRTVTSYPNFRKGLVAMHHLHQSFDMFVFDVAYKRKW